MKTTTWWRDYRPWLLVLLIQAPSLRNYFSTSALPYPSWVLAAVSIVILAAGYLFFHNRFIRIHFVRALSSVITTFILLGLTAAASYILYPKIEGIGIGGTGDDAMVVPAQAFLNGTGMYNVRLFDGAPVSPGAGWIALNALFVLTGTFGLMNSFYMALPGLLAVLRKKCWNSPLNAVLLFSLGSFAAIEQLASRQDLLAIGFAFLACAILGEEYLDQRNALWIGLLAGVLATARIIFIAFPIVVTLVYWKKNPPAFAQFGAIATITALAIHMAGYLTSSFYQPLHLILDRGPYCVGPAFIVAGAVVSLALLALALRDPRNTAQRRMGWVALLISLPLVFIAMGELVSGHFDVSHWEAARYLLPAFPLALFWIFLSNPLSVV